MSAREGGREGGREGSMKEHTSPCSNMIDVQRVTLSRDRWALTSGWG